MVIVKIFKKLELSEKNEEKLQRSDLFLTCRIQKNDNSTMQSPMQSCRSLHPLSISHAELSFLAASLKLPCTVVLPFSHSQSPMQSCRSLQSLSSLLGKGGHCVRLGRLLKCASFTFLLGVIFYYVYLQLILISVSALNLVDISVKTNPTVSKWVNSKIESCHLRIC